jgi:HPt (histidine-containing phosphotransfer) domain-containing protein
VNIPPLDGIDTTAGLEVVQKNTHLYLKLLHKFADNHRGFAREFDEAVNEGDWELVQRSAHSLKGVAGNIGAISLQEASKRVESLAREKTCDDAARNLMYSELQRVLSSLATLPADEQAESEPYSEGNVATVLMRLGKQLSDYDTEAQDTLEANHSLFSKGELATVFQPLKDAVEAYDYDTAKELLDEALTLITGTQPDSAPDSSIGE